MTFSRSHTSKKSHKTILAAAAIGAIGLMGASQAQASIINWTGSTSTAWATAGNWTGATTPPTNDLTTDIANFNLATYGGNPVFAPDAGTRSIAGITIGATNGTMTLAGTQLSIGSSGITVANGAGAFTLSTATTIAANQTWTNNSANTFTASGALTAGTGITLVKNGTGTLSMSGITNGAFDGTLRVDQGTVILGNGGNALGDATNRATLQLNGGNASFFRDGSTAYNFNLSVTANSTLTYGRSTPGAGPGTPTINSTTLGTAILDIQAGVNVTSGSQTLDLNGITLTGNGTIYTTNNATGSGTTMTKIDSVTGSGFNLTIGGTSRTELSLITTGTGGLTKNDAGTLSIVGVGNTYTGNTVLNGGTLTESTSNTLSSGSVLEINGGSFDLFRSQQVAGLSGTGGTWINTGGGTQTLSLVGSGTNSYSGNITSGASAVALTVALTGAGTQTLTGTNTYTGATAITGGRLYVNGTHTTAAAYAVNTAGTLGGTGSITTAGNASVVVGSGGKLAPGAAATPGTLTLNLGTGKLNLDATKANNNGQFTFRLGTSSDQIVLGTSTGIALGTATGDNLSLDWSDFTFIPGVGFANGTYTLINASTNVTGGLSTGGILSGSIGGGTGTLSILGSQDLILTVTGVPSGGLATLTVTPSGAIANGGSVTINASPDDGTYTIANTTISGSGWSHSAGANPAIANGAQSAPNNDKESVLNHSNLNAINGSNQGRFSFDTSAAASPDASYAYTLSRTVTANVAPYNTTQTATILQGNTLNGYNVDATRSLGANQLGTSFTIENSLALTGSDKNLTMTIRERINGTPDDEVTANDLNFARFPNAGGKLFSDVVSIAGINGTVYVLTVSYDPADLGSVAEASLSLGWLNGSTDWINAVNGNNYGGGGSIFNYGDSAWTAIGGLTIDDLGSYGVSTSGNYVWAVVNNVGEFAVIPEPASLGLLALGGLTLLGRRRRSN